MFPPKSHYTSLDIDFQLTQGSPFEEIYLYPLGPFKLNCNTVMLCPFMRLIGEVRNSANCKIVI